eukprot:TRINITY_DN36543_c0_g1_i1.p1 TRINITY_DN36543_c0_g1~~TRINITY_DN36543_c0_g1_i1.p1  ORF type:complete len:721 (+),score=61.31 TRINITY_DN36543_c0_g1_i1:68-2230(+)
MARRASGRRSAQSHGGQRRRRQLHCVLVFVAGCILLSSLECFVPLVSRLPELHLHDGAGRAHIAHGRRTQTWATQGQGSNSGSPGISDLPEFWQDIPWSSEPAGRFKEDGVILGQGAFGVVARGVDQETGELVAIKRIAPSHQLAVSTARNEIEAANLIGQHSNVVQLISYYLDGEEGNSSAVLVYRLALGGNLQEWISQQHKPSFSVDYDKPKMTDEAVRMMRQLATGLRHIHSKDTQHRDLKPANILLSAGCTPLIADFGIALVNRTSRREDAHSVLGDFYFVDVDSLVTKNLPYTLDDDVYSLGEIFVRMLYGSYATGSELRQFVQENPTDVPQVAKIVASMLQPREERSKLSHLVEELGALRFQTLTSIPRPIVTSVFLGMGALVTFATVAEKTRQKSIGDKPGRPDSVFSRCSEHCAEFRVGRTQGKRVQLQDYYCHSSICWNITPGARSWRLLGVFDGHGGQNCAKFCAQFLPHEVRRYLRDVEDDAGTLGFEHPAVLRLAAEGVKQALESLDKLFVKYKAKTGDVALSGTTIAVALICPDGRRVICATIGDSRVALTGDWDIKDYDGFPPITEPGLVVTYPHRPGDQTEIDRIDQAGGFVEFGANGHRVNGVLGVSRAVGYAGIPDFCDCVPAKADFVIAERVGKSPGSVLLASDGLFPNTGDTVRVFGRLGEETDATGLETAIQREIDRAGGGDAAQAKDNVTLLACRLPAL